MRGRGAREGRPSGDGLRPHALGRPQVPDGRARRAQPHPQRGPSNDFVGRYGAAAAQPAGRLSRPCARRTCATWCEGLGQTTFVGSSGRVFPMAFKASPLLRAWLRGFEGLGVRFAPRHRLDRLGRRAGGSCSRAPARSVSPCTRTATMLALGGASWPRLGSDGGLGRPPRRSRRSDCAAAPGQYGLHDRLVGAFPQPLRGRAPEADRAHASADRTVRGEAVVTARRHRGRRRLRPFGAAAGGASERDGAALLRVDLRPDLDRWTLSPQRLAAARRASRPRRFLRKAAGLPPVGDRTAARGPRTRCPDPAALAGARSRLCRCVLTAMAPTRAGNLDRRRRRLRGRRANLMLRSAARRLRGGRDAGLGGAHRRLSAPGGLRDRGRGRQGRSGLSWRAGPPMPH